MRNTILLNSLLIITFSIIVCGKSVNDDISTIRDRLMKIAIWPAKENLSSVVADAISYRDTLNSSCYWLDIDYKDQNISNWSPFAHMLRLTVMLQALTAPGSSVQNQSQLWTATRCALNVWLVNDWRDPNWWFNEIGVPLYATSQLLMLGDNATEFEIAKIKDISYRANWWAREGQDVGANLVWMLQIQLYRSLATNNLTGVEQAIPLMWNDIKVLPLGGQGVQQDLSYHFHGLLLLSGTYGQEWAVALLVTILSTHQTKYQIDQDRLLLFARFLGEGDAWMTTGPVWDWEVLGRHIDRPNLERITFITPDWLRSLAELIPTKNSSTKLLNWADRLEDRPDAVPLIGNKHFFTSDFQVHRRANWSLSIKVQSNRTTPTECIIGENQKAEHLGQGVLNLWTNNVDDYVQIFPLFDWQSINGITVERGILVESCADGGHFRWTPKTFVGGASDENYGLVAMDTHTHNLTAQRSWYFYDDAIIALATNLTLNSSNTAQTTLASRLLPQGRLTVGFFNSTIVSLPDGNYSFPYVANKTSNVQWFHISGSNIGYLLQTQGQYYSLGIELTIKTNNYDTFGPFIYEKTGRMFTAFINHGTGPFTLDYQYMILPNVQATTMPQLVKRFDDEKVFSCISTNNLLHGTAWPTLKRASFVSWHDNTTSFSCNNQFFQLTAELNNAGIYMFSETDTDFSITVSHPTHINRNITLTVNRSGSATGCAIQTESNASVTKVTLILPTAPELLGQSVTVTCRKTTMTIL